MMNTKVFFMLFFFCMQGCVSLANKNPPSYKERFYLPWATYFRSGTLYCRVHHEKLLPADVEIVDPGVESPYFSRDKRKMMYPNSFLVFPCLGGSKRMLGKIVPLWYCLKCREVERNEIEKDDYLGNEKQEKDIDP